MHPALKPEQAAIVQRVAELSRETFAKRAERYDRESRFPLENYADLHKACGAAVTSAGTSARLVQNPLIPSVVLTASSTFSGAASTSKRKRTSVTADLLLSFKRRRKRNRHFTHG